MGLIQQGDIVLCEFWFSNLQAAKKRPVMVLKDNLPYDDFIGIPISSKINRIHSDEMIIDVSDFSEGSIPVTSKIILRKTFVVSKSIILRKYGTLSEQSFLKYHKAFCRYFYCNRQ